MQVSMVVCRVLESLNFYLIPESLRGKFYSDDDIPSQPYSYWLLTAEDARDLTQKSHFKKLTRLDYSLIEATILYLYHLNVTTLSYVIGMKHLLDLKFPKSFRWKNVESIEDWKELQVRPFQDNIEGHISVSKN